MKGNESDAIQRSRKDFSSQIIALGKQLGLDSEQISSILDNTQDISERSFLNAGPPLYGSGFYGTISVDDFNVLKKRKIGRTWKK